MTAQTTVPTEMLAYSHSPQISGKGAVLDLTPPLDALPASVYIARLDDLARLLIRLLHAVPTAHLSYRERKRLHRTVGKLIEGVSRPELLIEMDKGNQAPS